MNRRDHRALTLAIVLTLGASAFAVDPAAEKKEDQPLSVDEIIARTNYVSYYQGHTGRARVRMTITDSESRTRVREFAILRWDKPHPDAKKEKDKERLAQLDRQFTDEQKFYLYFERPADVNRMGFLVWKHLQRDDDRWLYLPALDLVKRIASSDKRTSFVGSDFFYEDVSGRNLQDDKHELVETNETYYVLKNTPKAPASVEFAYFKMWIHRKTFLVVQTRYYDKQDREYRRYEALGVQHIQGFPTVVKSRMSNLESGGNTVLEYEDVRYDIEVPESVFSERYLRTPPHEHLK
jgi:outer membrane lipoprotein-sorting protein